MLLELAIFLVLVVIPVAINIGEVPDRLRDLRAGIGGVLYVPAVVVVLFAVAIGAWLLAQRITILQWGWLGQNIIAAPISDLLPAAEQGSGAGPTPGGTGTGGVGRELGPALTLAIFVPIMLLALLLFNFYEEAFYRDSLKEVTLWAVLHLVMGIPLFAVIPIFAVGLIYKTIRDRRGLQTAYVTHFATNCTLILLMVGSILLGPPA
jgi:membrane protease YdiL (CAAX protease family)